MTRRKSLAVTSNSVSGCGTLGEDVLSEHEATEAAYILGALSDPVRLRLLSMIASAGEVCSCDLQGPLGKSQPTVSHHTKVLADVGLIVGEKRGRWTWWHVVPGQLSDVSRILSR